MAVFLCRWPNGDVSIVSARTAREARIILDEFANADHAKIVRMNEFLVDLKLNNCGRLELSQLGEATYDEVMKQAYPVLSETLTSDALSRLSVGGAKYRALVRDAVELERKRMSARRRRLPAAKTELGSALQSAHDFPAAKADALVDEFATERLEELDSDTVH